MSCDQVRSQLSDFLENALAASTRQQMLRHLEGCAPCRTELRDLQVTLRALRGSPLEEPPAELEKAILAEVSSLPSLSAVHWKRPVAGIRWKAAIRQAAAALLLFALFLCIHLFSETSWKREMHALGARLIQGDVERSDLQLELSGKEKAWSEEKKELLEEIEATRKEAIASRESQKESLLSREEGRRLEAKSAELEAKIRLQAGRIADLEGKLSTSAEEAALCSSKLLMLERQLSGEALSSPLGSQEPGSSDPAEGRAGSEEGNEASRLSRLRTPVTPHLVFRRRGDSLEVEAKGPLSAVISELFEVAKDDSYPELSSLALSSLESLLSEKGGKPTTVEQKKAQEAPGLLARCHRGIALMASEAGFTGMEEGRSNTFVPEESSHRQRLRALQEVWRFKK